MSKVYYTLFNRTPPGVLGPDGLFTPPEEVIFLPPLGGHWVEWNPHFAFSTDPQRKMIDESSIKEAIIILEAEGRGIVEGAERPDLSNGEPNLDFKVKSPGNYKYVDVKEPRNFVRGNQDLDSAARPMVTKFTSKKNNLNSVF